MSSDSLTGVPKPITDRLLDSSDHRAADTFLAKAKIHENLQAQPVTEAIPMTTETVDLNNLPALDTLPAMKVVIVTFGDSDKEYHFFAPDSAQVGDYCVVYAGSGRQTPENRAFPFSIGKIERDTPDLENRARSAILGTFNESFARAVQQRMDVRSAIMSRLQQKRKQFEDMAVYQMMAEKDPETAQLLEQLNKL